MNARYGKPVARSMLLAVLIFDVLCFFLFFVCKDGQKEGPNYWYFGIVIVCEIVDYNYGCHLTRRTIPRNTFSVSYT